REDLAPVQSLDRAAASRLLRLHDPPSPMMSLADGTESLSVFQPDPPPAVEPLGRVRDYQTPHFRTPWSGTSTSGAALVPRVGDLASPWLRPGPRRHRRTARCRRRSCCRRTPGTRRLSPTRPACPSGPSARRRRNPP